MAFGSKVVKATNVFLYEFRRELGLTETVKKYLHFAVTQGAIVPLETIVASA